MLNSNECPGGTVGLTPVLYPVVGKLRFRALCTGNLGAVAKW